MITLLFVLGGLTLGFSLVFFVAPQQINKRNIGNISLGPKPKNKDIENMMNKIIYIDDKISSLGRLMGIFLLIVSLLLFWAGHTIVAR